MTNDNTPDTKCTDPLGCFLAAYEEYLLGERRYEDLPAAFAMCPTAKHKSHEAKR